MMRYLIYRDTAGLLRWRLKAKNGLIIADSGQGYKSMLACRRAIKLVKASSSAPVLQ